MWTALTILLWLLAAVLVLLLAVLASPLRIEARASAGEALRYSLALRPFGRFGPRLAVADSEKPKKKKKAKTKREKEKSAKSGKATYRDPRPIVRAVVRLVSEITGQLHIEKAALDLRFGADDPAETGEIYGALAPFIYGTAHSRRVYVNVEPVFDRVVFDGRAALDVTMTPALLLPPIARFGWSAFGPRR